MPARPLRLHVTDLSEIGAARRAATQLATEAGADEIAAGRVAIVASELATNLARYGAAGELLIQSLQLGAVTTVEILAVDSGPGIADLGRCLTDGYSTGGTPGNGLGAVRRLSAVFDIYSQPGKGTVVLARVPAQSAALAERAAPALEFGAISVPLAGETLCGDAWRLVQRGDRLAVIVVDGLGHGAAAASAAQRGIEAFAQQPLGPPSATLQRAHAAMAGSRGGAVAVGLIELASARLQYGGVGNIVGALVAAADKRGLISHNGTVGAQLRRVQDFDYPCPSGALLVMHSDGLSAKWQLSDYSGLSGRHPALIAAVLYRDFRRSRDDATVVVIRIA